MNEPVLSCFRKQAKPCKQIEQGKWFTMTKPVILATREVIRLLSLRKSCQKNAVNFTVTVLACWGGTALNEEAMTQLPQ